MSLIQDGFRTITGTTGDVNKKAFRVETSFATIGIRGTDHLGEITPQGLVAGVFRSGTQLDNPFGSLPLGVDADFDVGLLSDPNSPPSGLLDWPAGTGNIAITPDEEVREEEEEEDDGNGAADGNGNADGDADADSDAYA